MHQLTIGQQAFYTQFKQARAVVPEPAQPPKIKLKVGQTAEPPSSSKKITIHVGNRGGSVDSPAPQTGGSTGSPASGLHMNGTARTSGPPPSLNPLDKARSVSAAAASPSPMLPVAMKAEDSVRMSPAYPPRPPSATPGYPLSVGARPPVSFAPPQPQPHYNNMMVNGAVDSTRYRPSGKGGYFQHYSQFFAHDIQALTTHSLRNCEFRLSRATRRSAHLHWRYTPMLPRRSSQRTSPCLPAKPVCASTQCCPTSSRTDSTVSG